MPTTWNPADKGTGVILSNGDLTAALPDGGNMSVRSTTSKGSGKWYFELTATWTQVSNMQRIPGIMTGGADVNTSWPGSNTGEGCGIYPHVNSGNWLLVFNGGTTTLANGFTDSDVVGVSLDCDNGLLYFTKNGSSLKGDPAAGTGGQSVAVTTWYAAAGGGGSTIPQITGNFGATAFAYGPPVGFNGWDEVYVGESFTTYVTSITRLRKPVGV